MLGESSWRDRVFQWITALALVILMLGGLVAIPLPQSRTRRIIARLTGGRPMIRLARPEAFANAGPDLKFIPLAYWHDAYGRAWLAQSRWSHFRIRVPEYDAR